MRSINENRVRLAALVLAVAGIVLAVYPAVRPFSDEASLLGAAAFASVEWIAAHGLAMLGFMLLAFGLTGLYVILRKTSVERLMFRAVVISWAGIMLTLPYYGAETFGLYVVGEVAILRQDDTLMHMADQIRFGPGFMTIIAGLLLLAAGSVMSAVAIWRSRILARWSGVPSAVGILLYLPQYMATQPVRVAHGLLLTTGCLWMAIELWRAGS